MNVAPRSHVPLAAALTLAFGVLLYAALRAGQVLLTREPDPAVALYDAHAGFFWRIWLSIYGAGLAAPLAMWLVRARAAWLVHAWPLIVTAVASIAALQALLLP